MRRCCDLNADSEYAFHYEFSPSITKRYQEDVQEISNDITQHGNPFVLSNPSVVNLLTGVQLDQETTKFLLSCIDTGEHECIKGKVNRLQNKTEKLLENIPKLRKANRKPDGSILTYDIRKETITFMRNIDRLNTRI